MAAATRVIVTQGLSAPTAPIARRGGRRERLALHLLRDEGRPVQPALPRAENRDGGRLRWRGSRQKAALREQFFTSGRTGCAGRRPTLRSGARSRCSAFPTKSRRRPAPRRTRRWRTSPSCWSECRANGADAQRADGVCRRDHELAGGGDDGLHGSRPRQREKHCKAGFDALWRMIG